MLQLRFLRFFCDCSESVKSTNARYDKRLSRDSNTTKCSKIELFLYSKDHRNDFDSSVLNWRFGNDFVNLFDLHCTLGRYDIII